MKILSSQANIRNTFFDQRSPQHPEVGVSQSCRQTGRQTDGHGKLYDSVKMLLNHRCSYNCRLSTLFGKFGATFWRSCSRQLNTTCYHPGHPDIKLLTLHSWPSWPSFYFRGLNSQNIISFPCLPTCPTVRKSVLFITPSQSQSAWTYHHVRKLFLAGTLLARNSSSQEYFQSAKIQPRTVSAKNSSS